MKAETARWLIDHGFHGIARMIDAKTVDAVNLNREMRLREERMQEWRRAWKRIEDSQR